ncbi:ATPase, T2SS/T4P/T4SS family [Burkholderia gladioli]|uniref:ATPase, T2SS/T4P/T4SS family n=1 Tax=Burkholderia gladioli TaxID=28095 RepID=UPI0016402816|nr:ATPase, T2SS/T4P/T4SS family [Burkholderia gladioli]MBJ9677883.1 Flp pilus assembly complex ATPase component TadA [Burkholderia gladioli]
MSTPNSAVSDQPLGAVSFSDLYLEPDGRAWFKTYGSDPLRHTIPATAQASVAALRAHVLQSNKRNFRVEWEGMSLRSARFNTSGGDLFVLRRSPQRALDFSSLGYGARIEAALLGPRQEGGRLYLFTGETGSGKTVGLTAWTVERMRRFGGAGFTIENPIEIPLAGEYRGDHACGTLYQTEVDDDAEFGPEIRERLRAAPNLLMLGEVRTADAVAQAMLAATSGIDVGVTFHAADQINGLQRLASMVRDAGCDAGMFANSLAAVLHQKLARTERDGSTHWQLSVSPLIVNGSREERAIRSHLHGSDFRQLQPIIARHEGAATSTARNVGF